MTLTVKAALALTSMAFGALAGLWCTAGFADESRLILPATADANIEMTLADEQTPLTASDVLRVFVGPKDACCAGRSPMSGRYDSDGGRVIFDPAFDLIDGQTYTVMTRDLVRKSSTHLTEFTLAAQDTIAPQVLAVHPGGKFIPENTLRFYIQFATPMQPHRSTEFIKLIDSSGAVDVNAFMSFKQELWSEDRRRLTVLMDPGRIKRGVAQNLALGPALESGKKYTLVVEAGWPNVIGDKEAPRFEYTFNVNRPLRTRPDTDLWQIDPPRIGTRDPLVLQFDRPFDHQMSQKAIKVAGANGQPILGAPSVSNAGTLWQFKPQTAWVGARINLIVDARLEDVAGNNFRETLDHPVGKPMRDIDQTSLWIPLLPSR